MPSKQVPETNFAHLFRNRSAKYGSQTRWRQKRSGVWRQATGRENQAMVNSLIAGLDEVGARRGDVVGIASNTRWEWAVADWANIGLGCVTVTLYPSNTPAVNSFILNDSGASYIFAEDKTQYNKLASIRAEIPNVRKVILFEDADKVSDPWVISFAEVLKLSKRSPKEQDAFAAQRASEIQPDDLLTLVYTSGTTGMPKGVVHSHNTFLAQLRGARAVFPQLEKGMIDALFLPLSHVFGRLEHFVGVDRGFETVYVQSFDQLAETLREARPHLLFSVPRVYEKVYASVREHVDKGSPTQKRVFAWAENVGREVSRRKEAHKGIPLGLRMQYALADRLVFKNVRKALGGRLRLALTGAAPLDIKILEFFNACGTTLLEGWGLTETSAGFTVNTLDHYRMGTVGRVYPGSELKIAEDGEILVRGPEIFLRYNNNPEATAEALDPDGWFHTGDIGTVDHDGYVKIVDRKKDLIITAAGKNIGPQQIENVFKQVPLLSQACVYGDRKPYLVALFTLDPVAATKWAEANGLGTSDVAEIARSPQLRAFLEPHVAAANSQLASYETVKYWDVLPEDFTVANELLTPTLKIRRKLIYQKYGDLYEQLYAQADARRAATA
jgi:long-chain acyl-CoA synthetase